MSLTSDPFLTLVLLVTLAALVATVLLWPRWAGPGARALVTRTLLVLGVNALVLLTAATQLNAQFLFYAGWADLGGAFGDAATSAALQRGGSASAATTLTPSGPAATVPTGPLPALPPGGDVLSFRVSGALSGVTGTVVVHLPPGYRERAQAAVRYPVLETFHGYPGTPMQWLGPMDLAGAVGSAAAARTIRPLLIVSPQLEVPPGVDTECVDGVNGAPRIETWVTRDVPDWVARTFRVAPQRASWATIGLSAGGWCAAMATMLHPAQYAAAIVMGGYFRPDFSPTYLPYPASSPLTARYDLIRLSRRAPPPVALWVETSHTDAVSYGSSAALLRGVRAPMAVDATVLQHAGHRVSLWQGLLPTSLQWLGAHVPGFAPLR